MLLNTVIEGVFFFYHICPMYYQIPKKQSTRLYWKGYLIKIGLSVLAYSTPLLIIMYQTS